MSQNQCRVHLRKDSFKFAAAHMTVFQDGSKEALHGHNYTVAVDVDLADPSFNQFVPFSLFKDTIREICEKWDEKVLLAEQCPFFQVTSASGHEIEFRLCKKRYVLPRDEVVLLPIDNLTVEALAVEFGRQMITLLGKSKAAHAYTGILVRIEESPGQGASSSWPSLT